MAFPLLRWWSTPDCDEVVLFEGANCAGRHREMLWRVWNQSKVSYCQRHTGRSIYLGLELLHGSCPIFKADNWITIFTVSAWLRSTIPFWQKRTLATFISVSRLPWLVYNFHVLQHKPSNIVEIPAGTEKSSMLPLKHVLWVNPAHSPHLKVTSQQATNEVLVLPDVRVSKRSTKFQNLHND